MDVTSTYGNFPPPVDFRFPEYYLTLLDAGLPEIDPWWWLVEAQAQSLSLAEFWSKTLREQFPYRNLVPFAKNEGSDDVVCFDGSDTSGDPKIYLIHGFCSPGYELRDEFANFRQWFEFKLQEAIQHQRQDNE
jgi:hypothetical protein